MKVRVGNLTFDGVDSKMLHLGEFGGPELGGAIRFTNFKNGTWIKAQQYNVRNSYNRH